MKAVGLCDHCSVPLVRWRTWPDAGALGDCPNCKSTFLRLGHLMASIREDLVLANMAARIAAGPIVPDLDRPWDGVARPRTLTERIPLEKGWAL